MFICAFCSKSTRLGEPMTRIVVRSEPIEYPERPEAYPPRSLGGKRHTDPGGVGTRIIEERPACPRCATLRVQA